MPTKDTTHTNPAMTHEIGIKLLNVKQNVSMSLMNLPAETGLPSPPSPSKRYHISLP